MSWIGQSVPRLEDERLLLGQGAFTDDFSRPGQLYAAFLRSDVACGKLLAVDCSAAHAMTGVEFVLSALDAPRCGLGHFPILGQIPDQVHIPRPVMPTQIRHVGEIIAMVVASDPMIALDALETIEVDIDQAQPTLALDNPDPDHIAYDWRHGDRRRLEDAFAKAAWTAEVTACSNRVIVHPLETRAALAEFDEASGQITLHTSSQGAHKIRDMVATAMGIERQSIRVVTPDVGGAFGTKLQAYPEQVLVAFAAQETNRPVRWTASRRESSLMDAQGRGQSLTARLALGAKGEFLALDISNVADLGAYTTGFGALTPSLSGGKVVGHAYQIPKICMRVQACYTNTVPIDAYRGAGKPEMVYIVERVIEEAAHLAKIDPVELRRRNLISDTQLPYLLPLGQKIDTAAFETVLNRVIDLSDWASFPERRANARARGQLAGIGVGLHMHVSGGFTNERSLIQILGDGRIIVDTGTQTGGQGHATLFAQIVASELDVAVEHVTVRQGDTGHLSDGGGTGGSSSLPIAGVNIQRAAVELIDQAYQRAADHLEAAVTDVTYGHGTFRVIGTDRQVTVFELAQHSELSTGCDYDGDQVTFPNGAYVAEVEIDPETGRLTLVRFTGVDDIGVVFNPMIATGQIHGGIVQGLGQALLENCLYDEAGQLMNATLMDYALPRADDVCTLDCYFEQVPSKANPLGAKGAGELGPAGALAPVVHAVLDALTGHQVRSIDMPMTSETIWRAIHLQN